MAEKTKYDIGIKMKDMFNKDKCRDLFRDYENQHQGNSGNKDFITQYVNMKVEITLKKKNLSMINTFIKTGLFQGKQYIQAVLRRIKLTKDLFIINLN